MNAPDIAVLTFLLACSLGLGLLTIFHELGHALTALALSRQPVHIYLGTSPTRIEQKPVEINLIFTLNKFTFYLYLPGLLYGIGYAKWSKDLSRSQNILALLGGPVTTLLLLLLLSVFTYMSRLHTFASMLKIWEYYLLQWLSMIAFIQFLATAIPIHYSFPGKPETGYTSDGYSIKYWLQHKS